MTDAREYAQQVAEQVLDNVRTAQAAAVSSVSTWAEAAQTVSTISFMPEAARWSGRLPRPSVLVDDLYDVAEKVIANQREFGRNLVTAAQPVAEPAAAPA